MPDPIPYSMATALTYIASLQRALDRPAVEKIGHGVAVSVKA